MTPIVDFARIYALKNGIAETNTLDRLEQLRIKHVLKPKEYEELEKAYQHIAMNGNPRIIFTDMSLKIVKLIRK